ncbi:hypothetical protein [Bernardetia sp. MNP-M8]|uniref:hypothetical protein n=1 Tax=Bernardetia sp. MNP-M8 TaxID=3127470 RepID=UPI0030CFC5EC
MNKKSRIHEEVMAFLDNYLENTPKEIIREEIAAISRKKFVGSSANSYFLDFDKHYLHFDDTIPTNNINQIELPSRNLVQKRKKNFSRVSIKSNNLAYFDKKDSKKMIFRINRFNSFTEKPSVSNTINKTYDEYL